MKTRFRGKGAQRAVSVTRRNSSTRPRGTPNARVIAVRKWGRVVPAFSTTQWTRRSGLKREIAQQVTGIAQKATE